MEIECVFRKSCKVWAYFDWSTIEIQHEMIMEGGALT